MPDTPVLTLSCPKTLRTNGDIVSGTLNLNLALAAEKDVEAVTISMRGDINTQVTVQSTSYNSPSLVGSGAKRRTTFRDRVRLFNQKQTVWTPGSQLPPHTSGIAEIPFSFTMPTTNLPPSFQAGNSRSGGSVQYYLHVVAVRKSWYQMNIRINQAFPFLPLDGSPAPSFDLPNWPHEWQVFNSSKRMRKGIISQYGLAVAEFHMPRMSAIPLFRPIPIRLRIVCTSKPLSRSAADIPSQFEFPRTPKAVAVELTLRQICTVIAQGFQNQCEDNLGSQAGFGRPNHPNMRAIWGDQIQTTVIPPYWIDDEKDRSKGRWSEEINFSSTLVLRCPTPFNSPSIMSSVFLDLNIHFPGLGNKLETAIGPLPLTSGIAHSEAQGLLSRPPLLPSTNTTFASNPPSPLDREMDLPPSYFEVLQMDEHAGRGTDD